MAEYEYGARSVVPEVDQEVTTWHSSQEEAQALVDAVNKNSVGQPGETFLIRRLIGDIERVEETAHASS